MSRDSPRQSDVIIVAGTLTNDDNWVLVDAGIAGSFDEVAVPSHRRA
ncbi:hypothetical protein I6F30_19585 [Bradyrhizobium sp. NBAIM20]|nr:MULTISPECIES: hypothetical protein [unclassified Bradyrhizobium]MCA1413321.1 hypothetical protein [Bradyrhizobium sp. NBAIM20]MCA1461081.1 hypothetical protein [Bradyrhizobium sp. NBAIM18]